MSEHEYTVMHLFSGLGGGAVGFQRAGFRYRDEVASFRTVLGIDSDRESCEDFRALTGAPAMLGDLGSERTRATILKHGPPKVRKALANVPHVTRERLVAAVPECPDVVFASPPCKGFSGLLGNDVAKRPYYEALNALVFDGLSLVLTAWPTKPKLVLLENVPRITTRGAELLMRLQTMLREFGYRCDIRSHCCGKLGGLAQRRSRLLLLARLDEACLRPVSNAAEQEYRTVGDVIGPMPMPDDMQAGGPMHRLPRLSWLNWVRLALIPAGGDWRDLPGVLEDGQARREVHRRHMVTPWDEEAATVAGPGSNGVNNVADPRVPGKHPTHTNKYRVEGWDGPARTVTGSQQIGSGGPSVADPRVAGFATSNEGAKGEEERLPAKRGAGGNPYCYGVLGFDQQSHTVTGKASTGTGPFSVADPRKPVTAFRGVYRVLPWDAPAGTVTGSAHASTGGFSVADPRLGGGTYKGKYTVMPWDGVGRTVIGGPSKGASFVQDPRLNHEPRRGAYGVLHPDEQAGAVTGAACFDNGRWAYADGREIPEVDPKERPDPPPLIIAEDGTWHRPLTTLELAALQSLPLRMPDGRPLTLAGKADSRWRERIGNAVPPDAAAAVATVLLESLLMSAIGMWLMPSGGTGTWVRRPRASSVVRG